jgi:hypothetical protein
MRHPNPQSDEAFAEPARVNQSGIGLGTIASGLVALARGSSSSARANDYFAAFSTIAVAISAASSVML